MDADAMTHPTADCAAEGEVGVRDLIRPAVRLLAIVLAVSVGAAGALAATGIADGLLPLVRPIAALATLVGLSSWDELTAAVTPHWDRTLSPADVPWILLANVGVALAPLAAAMLVQAPVGRGRERLFDGLLVVYAARQVWPLIVLLAAYPAEMTARVAAYLPLEFAGFSLAGAAYLAGRDGRRVNLPRTLAVCVAVLLAAAVVEVATAGRLG